MGERKKRLLNDSENVDRRTELGTLRKRQRDFRNNRRKQNQSEVNISARNN